MPAFRGLLAGAALLAPLALGLSGLPAAASDPAEDFHSWRVGTFAGGFVPDTAGWQGSGALSGLPFTANGRLSLNTGYAVGGLVGYAFDDFLGIDWLKRRINLDLEMGYVTDTLKSFNGAISLAGSPFNGTVPLTGSANTLAGSLNFLVTPFGQHGLGPEGQFTPYFGIGPGFARTNINLKSFSLGPNVLPVNSAGGETDFALNFIIGVDYRILPQTLPHLELGVAYEYTEIDASHLGTGPGIVANSSSISGHILGVVLEYNLTQD